VVDKSGLRSGFVAAQEFVSFDFGNHAEYAGVAVFVGLGALDA